MLNKKDALNFAQFLIDENNQFIANEFIHLIGKNDRTDPHIHFLFAKSAIKNRQYDRALHHLQMAIILVQNFNEKDSLLPELVHLSNDIRSGKILLASPNVIEINQHPKLREFAIEFHKKHDFPLKYSDPDHMLLIHHISGNGGTSLLNGLKMLYQEHEIVRILDPNTYAHFTKSSTEETKKLKLVYNHWGRPLHPFIDRQNAYISILRDPVSRMIHGYYWNRIHGNEDIANHGLLYYLDHLKDRSEFDNFWCRQICEICPEAPDANNILTIDLLQTTKLVLDTYFPFIIILEYFDECVFVLCLLMGAPAIPKYVRGSVSNAPSADNMNPDIIQKMKKMTEVDRLIHRELTNKFESTFADAIEFFRENIQTLEIT